MTRRITRFPGAWLAALAVALLLPSVAVAQEIDELFPSCGAAGDPVLIRGLAFGDEPLVEFGGVEAKVVRSDEERILCRVPEGVAPGAATVSVDGVDAAEDFTVVADGAPVILRLSATTVTPDMVVFLVGRRLKGGSAEFVDAGDVVQGTAELKGGRRAAFLRVPETLAAGTYTLRVTNEDELDTGDCSPGIEVVPAGAPILDSILPEGELAGRHVVCHGTDLGPIGPCVVSWTDGAGETLKSFGFANGYDKVRTRVPFHAEPGTTYDVAVTFRDDATTEDTGLPAYTVGTPEAPVIDELDPSEGPAGSVFHIRGENLLVVGSKPVVELEKDGVKTKAHLLFAKPGFFGGAEELVAGVPLDTEDGDHAVTVTVGEQVSNATAFTVADRPLAVDSMKPDSQGPKGTFHPVRIQGSGFGLPGPNSRSLKVVWDNGVNEAREGKVVFRTDRLILVIPPGGRFHPLDSGDYEVSVVLGSASPSGPEESALAGTYTVK